MRGIPIGYDENGRALSYKKEGSSSGEGHLFLSAPPRSGKGRDILIPALLQYQEGSCIVIDPKGQLAAITMRQRKKLGRVFILNPFNILPNILGPTAHYNPMDSLSPEAESFGVDCDVLGDGIVSMEHGREIHWSESAHELISGVIMQLAANCLPHERNLTAVRRLIAGTNTDLVNFCREASGVPGFIADRLARFSEEEAKNANEIASIISTAKTQTKFISNTAIAENLAASDFRFSDLKVEPITVYLVLPVRYLGSCGKWFRLVLASALNELLTENRGLPVLCVLDEFAQLGRLAVIENTLGLAAGMGVQLWPVLQDLTQLKELYPHRWESFLGSAGVQMFFAPRENTSATYISDLCGHTTIKLPSESRGTSKDWLGAKTSSTEGTSVSLARRPALFPQEVRQLPGDKMIMFHDGLPGRFIDVHRKPYWEIPALQGLYDHDPYHKARA